MLLVLFMESFLLFTSLNLTCTLALAMYYCTIPTYVRSFFFFTLYRANYYHYPCRSFSTNTLVTAPRFSYLVLYPTLIFLDSLTLEVASQSLYALFLFPRYHTKQIVVLLYLYRYLRSNHRTISLVLFLSNKTLS